MRSSDKYIRRFSEIGIEDIPLVGGKNASLGEMYQQLTSRGVKIPNGFAVTAGSLPADVEVTHINLNDNCIEGLRHKAKPIFSIQYHPESSPGPHDALEFFKQFVEMMAARKV